MTAFAELSCESSDPSETRQGAGTRQAYQLRKPGECQAPSSCHSVTDWLKWLPKVTPNADILWACHAFFLGEDGLRDDPLTTSALKGNPEGTGACFLKLPMTYQAR